VSIIIGDIIPTLKQQSGFTFTVLHRNADGTEVLQCTRWMTLLGHEAVSRVRR
jgi:hypothetical protein